MAWTRVCQAAQLPEGSATAYRDNGHNIGVYHTEQGLFAIHNICPHVHTELHNGDIREGVVYCPRHNWPFQLKDGACSMHERYNLASYPVKEEDGHILVDPNNPM